MIALVALFLSVVSIVISVYAMCISRQTQKIRQMAAGPLCGCGHHLSFHESRRGAGIGSCHRRGQTTYGSEGARCGCQQYIGPEPSPEHLLWQQLWKGIDQ